MSELAKKERPDSDVTELEKPRLFARKILVSISLLLVVIAFVLTLFIGFAPQSWRAIVENSLQVNLPDLGWVDHEDAITEAEMAQERAFQRLVKIGTMPAVMPLRESDIEPETAREINENRPFSNVPNPPAAPFEFQGPPEDWARAVTCLASAQWYEAGSDWEGQRAVAQVVLNRVRHPTYPSSICATVFQGSKRRTGCQFSFTCDGSMRRIPSPRNWARTFEQAKAALNGSVYEKVGYATHYHTDWVAPYWSSSLDKITKVNTHIFFRWKGDWGKPYAFRASQAKAEPKILKLAMLSSVHGSKEEALALLEEEIDQIALENDVAVEEQMALAKIEALRAEPELAKVNMRGSKLRIAHPQGGAYILQLSPSAHSGSYAVTANAMCQNHKFCKVMGWIDGQYLPSGFPIPPSSRKTMSFLYIKDHRSNQLMMLWDCSRKKRKNPAQCITERKTEWNYIENAGRDPSIDPIQTKTAESSAQTLDNKPGDVEEKVPSLASKPITIGDSANKGSNSVPPVVKQKPATVTNINP